MEEREEKREAPEITARPKWLLWLDNIWYHYKWVIIGALFVIFMLVVSLVQCSKEKPADITVVYAGNYAMSEQEMQNIKQIMGAACPKDYDGNGDKVANLLQFSVFTEEQLTALYTFYDEATGEYKVDETGKALARGANGPAGENFKSVQSYIMTGECAIWLVSPYVYESLLYREDPASNWVMQATPLKDTPLYTYYDAMRCLPEDTILLLTVSPVVGHMSKAENHAVAQEYYQAILQFSKGDES